MRDNTAAILASPEFSLFTNAQGKSMAKLRFLSTGQAIAFCKAHGETSNESNWGGRPHWIGLEHQSRDNFIETGIAEHSRDLTLAASKTLSDKPSRPGDFRPAITGGFWDTPSVIAGLPLAARTRVRSKLPPKTIKIAMFLSAGVSANDLARITAKIAYALWQYTIAGGAVTLDVSYCGCITSSTGARSLAVETRVNAADLASLSAALSPVWFRAVTGRLITATSETSRDLVYAVRENPFPDALWIGGVLTDAIKAGDAVLSALKLD